MVVMQLGIFRDYWGDFTDNAWSVHVHYLTGTVWYLYLIIQPYLATHGHLQSHRTNGMIGMFLAGGVCLTAFSMMNRDIVTTQRAAATPEIFGPFEGWFFFGVAAVEIVMILAFGYAVIQGIIHRKRLEDHAWWLMSTVFIIMMPALARGIQNVHVAFQRDAWPDIDIMSSIYLTQIIILGMIVVAAIRYEKLRHPATYLAVAVNSFNFFLEPLGRNKAVQSFLETVIKG